MGQNSKIEWTDTTWNPVRGCSVVSEGCRNCYAMAVAARFSGPGKPYEGLAYRNDSGAHWTGKVQVVDKRLEDPLRWNSGTPAPGHLEVNHENGIKSDNRPNNLELMTGSENIRHAYRTGLKDQRGEKNPAHKISDNQVAAIRVAYERGDFNQTQLAAMHGVSFQCISKIVRGARRSSNLGPTGDYSARRSHNKVARDAETGQFRAA